MHIEGKDIAEFIQLAGMGFCTKDDIIETLEQVQAVVDDLNSEVAAVEDCLMQMEIRGESMDASHEKMREIVASYGVSPEDFDDYEQNKAARNKAAVYLGELQKLRDTYKNFDKAQCFANIRALMKNTDVKIGQIEREAGVRLGYMARLEKPDNTSEPSMEFIVTAAKMLNVSLDFLISAKIEATTQTEEYVLKFIRNVIKDTQDGKLIWNREAPAILNSTHNDYESSSRRHPLFEYDDTETDGNNCPYLSSYHSRFFPERRTHVRLSAYNADLPRTSSTLYIIPCTIFRGDESLESDDCFEVYIDDDDTVISLCSTMLTCDEVALAIKDLYNQIQEAASHIQINNRARFVIDAYMREDEPSGIMNIPDGIDEELPFN